MFNLKRWYRKCFHKTCISNFKGKNIKGNIAYLSPTEGIIVLNIGENAGVEEGMCFHIYPKKVIINDPMTGKFLDTLFREQMSMKVHEVRDKICICKAYRFPEKFEDFAIDRIEIGDVTIRYVNPSSSK